MKKWMVKNMGEAPTVPGYVEETDTSLFDNEANDKDDGFGGFEMDYQSQMEA